MSRRRSRRPDPRRPQPPRVEPPPAAAGYSNRIDIGVAIALTVAAGVLLAVFVSHAPSLWRDEVSSVHTQQAPTFAEMWRRAEFESFPALWMLLLRGWLAIGGGSSDATLRLFGLIGPVALIAGMWVATARINRMAPVLSLSLTVVNPEVLRWSATLRPWGLGAGLMLASTAFLWEAIRRPTRAHLIAAGLLSLLSVHCLFQNAVFLAAGAAGCAVVAYLHGRWRLAMIPLTIGAICAVSLLPYAGMIQRRADWNSLGKSPITVGELVTVFSDVVSAPGIVSWLVTFGMAGATVLLAARAWRRRDQSEEIDRDDVVVFTAITIVAAVGGLLLLYRWLGYPTQSWYYLGLLALIAVCVEGALRSRLPPRAAALAVGVGAAVVIATGGAAVWKAMHGRQTNVDVIADRLEVETSPSDLVLVNPWFLGVTMTRYYGGPSRVMTIPPIADRTISRYDLLKEQMLQPDATAPLRHAIDGALSSGHRVWLVGGFLEPPPEVRLPDSLPPPPLPVTEWNSTPYELLWSKKVALWLNSRSTGCRNVDPGVPGGALENAHLIVCQGWRRSAPGGEK
jgi:hypothetical protein